MGSAGCVTNGSPPKSQYLQKTWILEEIQSAESSELAALLKKLAEKPSEEIVWLGTQKVQPGVLQLIRESHGHVLVLHESSWPKCNQVEELCELELGFLIVASPGNTVRFRKLTEKCMVSFVSPSGGLEAIQLGLRNLALESIRTASLQSQINSLQQRLNDRIVIERAKGILVQKLGISEDEAYKRLRLSSRRQRRQIRDIAQSLIDSHSLLSFGDMPPPAREDLLASLPRSILDGGPDKS
jgi:hypothetical protein